MPEIREFRAGNGVTPGFHRGVVAYRDRTLPLVAEPRVLDEGVGMVDAGPRAFPDVADLSGAPGGDPRLRLRPEWPSAR